MIGGLAVDKEHGVSSRVQIGVIALIAGFHLITQGNGVFTVSRGIYCPLDIGGIAQLDTGNQICKVYVLGRVTAAYGGFAAGIVIGFCGAVDVPGGLGLVLSLHCDIIRYNLRSAQNSQLAVQVYAVYIGPATAPGIIQILDQGDRNDLIGACVQGQCNGFGIINPVVLAHELGLIGCFAVYKEGCVGSWAQTGIVILFVGLDAVTQGDGVFTVSRCFHFPLYKRAFTQLYAGN